MSQSLGHLTGPKDHLQLLANGRRVSRCSQKIHQLSYPSCVAIDLEDLQRNLVGKSVEVSALCTIASARQAALRSPYLVKQAPLESGLTVVTMFIERLPPLKITEGHADTLAVDACG